ncbi:MAG: hypothetical protein CV082_13640 [Candidatus Brocadia sp. BL1]|nr:MAG: hypothetical protein CV082_13640 [Candidatus Brocadia sp. BL1]
MIESEFCNRTQTNPARALLNFHSGVVESVQYIAGDFRLINIWIETIKNIILGQAENLLSFKIL